LAIVADGVEDPSLDGGLGPGADAGVVQRELATVCELE
jgi:hypothetical protein